MRKIISVVVLSAVLLVHSGCATIVSSGTQDFKVQSNPPGARVEIDGVHKGQTPLFLKLEREERHTVKIQKEGYVEAVEPTTRGFNWWFMANIVLGGIVGMVVDFCTGAVYTVKPKELNVELTPASSE